MKRKIIFVFIVCLMLTFFSEFSGFKSVFGDINDDSTVLIIDAGHGGMDGGAVGTMGTAEDDITLAISLKMGLLCDFLGINYKLTRHDENSLDFNGNASIKENKVADTRARTKLVNSFDSAMLISVHLNKFTTSEPKGAQIFYNSVDNAEYFANNLQQTIKNSLDSENNRESLKAPETVYLIKNSIHPAIIFECGFLSNPQEELLLIDEIYHTKLAICAISAYILG